MPYAELVFVSLHVTGQRMNKLFELIDMVRENQTHAYRHRRAQ